MGIPSLKDLKKLATACRKTGIVSFKFHQDGSYEFSLDPSIPTIKEKASKVDKTQPTGVFVPDSGDAILTEEQLLFWSSDASVTSPDKKPFENNS